MSVFNCIFEKLWKAGGGESFKGLLSQVYYPLKSARNIFLAFSSWNILLYIPEECIDWFADWQEIEDE